MGKGLALEFKNRFPQNFIMYKEWCADSPQIGSIFVWNENNQYIVNQRVGLLRCNNDFDIKYPYVYIMTNSEPFLSNLRKGANSGVQVNLSSEQIKNSEIIIPSKNINQQYFMTFIWNK